MEKHVSVAHGNSYYAFPYFILPPSQESYQKLLLERVTVWVPQSDVNYGLIMTFK